MRRITCFLFACAVAQAHCPTSTNSSSGGQLTLGPDALESGELFAAFRIEFAKFDRFDDEALERAAARHDRLHSIDSILWTSLEAEYGLVKRFSIGASLPYSRTRNFREASHHHHDGEAEEEVHETDISGLGDLLVYGHVQLLEGTFRVGLRFGVEAPIGDEDEEVEGEKLEHDHQPSNGAWDFHAGVSAGTSGDGWGVQAALTSIVHTRSRRDFEIGDVVRLGAGGSWRVGPADQKVAVWLTLDAWIEWHGRDRERGHFVRDSTGYVSWAAPGLRIAAGPAVVQLAVPLQIHNGIDDEPDEEWRAVLTCGTRF